MLVFDLVYNKKSRNQIREKTNNATLHYHKLKKLFGCMQQKTLPY